MAVLFIIKGQVNASLFTGARPSVKDGRRLAVRAHLGVCKPQEKVYTASVNWLEPNEAGSTGCCRQVPGWRVVALPAFIPPNSEADDYAP